MTDPVEIMALAIADKPCRDSARTDDGELDHLRRREACRAALQALKDAGYEDQTLGDIYRAMIQAASEDSA